MPLVSVVTMTHDQASYLADCIESVRSQTFLDYEHIIVDAGSTDHTVEVACRYPVKLYSIDDRGMCTSRNYGIARAQGAYVVSLDADDKLHPRFLEKLVAHASSSTIVCPGLQEFGSGRNAGWPTWSFTLDAFVAANRVFCCSMFPWEKWREVGGYDSALDWLSCEDWEFWTNLVAAGCRVAVVPELLFYYRVHGNSRTSRCQDKQEISACYIRQKHQGKLSVLQY